MDRGKARSLAEISPRMSRVGAIYKPKSAPGGGVYYWRLVDEAAAAMNLKVSAATVHDTTSIEETIDALARESNAGLLVMPDVFNVLHRKVIIAAAARHRLPAIHPIPTFTVDGGLASYGVDIPDLYRRAAGYVDRVLRGAKPSDLPVQSPAKFDLTINAKTAKALGISVPRALLLSPMNGGDCQGGTLGQLYTQERAKLRPRIHVLQHERATSSPSPAQYQS